jgi:hypothetical protein
MEAAEGGDRGMAREAIHRQRRRLTRSGGQRWRRLWRLKEEEEGRKN